MAVKWGGWKEWGPFMLEAGLAANLALFYVTWQCVLGYRSLIIIYTVNCTVGTLTYTYSCGVYDVIPCIFSYELYKKKYWPNHEGQLQIYFRNQTSFFPFLRSKNEGWKKHLFSDTFLDRAPSCAILPEECQRKTERLLSLPSTKGSLLPEKKGLLRSLQVHCTVFGAIAAVLL